MAILRGVSDKRCSCWTLAKGKEDNGFAGIMLSNYFSKDNKNTFWKQQKPLQEENASNLCLAGAILASSSSGAGEG